MSDSPVIAFLNKATDLILLNFLWILCSLPVITAGAATAAMYYVCITSIRCGDGYVAKRFFQSFKQNFRQITPLWICILLAVGLLTFDILFWMKVGTPFAEAMLLISLILCFFLYLWMLWLFPVFAKFEASTPELVRNAARFALGYLPYTAIVAAFTGFIFYINLKSLIANSIMLFLGFALLSYIQSFFFYRAFMNHMDKRYDDFWKEASKVEL